MAVTVNENMTIFEVLQLCPDIAPVFFEFGMHCLGCPVSRGETVAEAAAVHGVDVKEMVTKLNDFIAKSV
jgi:hybrid cluster-associated redox disulfide protein